MSSIVPLPMPTTAGDSLETFEEFPPRMKAASFTVAEALDKLQSPQGAH